MLFINVNCLLNSLLLLDFSDNPVISSGADFQLLPVDPLKPQSDSVKVCY